MRTCFMAADVHLFYGSSPRGRQGSGRVVVGGLFKRGRVSFREYFRFLSSVFNFFFFSWAFISVASSCPHKDSVAKRDYRKKKNPRNPERDPDLKPDGRRSRWFRSVIILNHFRIFSSVSRARPKKKLRISHHFLLWIWIINRQIIHGLPGMRFHNYLHIEWADEATLYFHILPITGCGARAEPITNSYNSVWTSLVHWERGWGVRHGPLLSCDIFVYFCFCFLF